MKITAKGKVAGLDFEVIAETQQNGKVYFFFNGTRDNVSEAYLTDLLKEHHNFGNYIPATYEDLNIYNVLKNYFPFDSEPEITAEGMKELPYDKSLALNGGVY